MKRIFTYITALSLALGTLTSCEDMFGSYLDKAPSAELEESEVFSDWTRTLYYHNNIYTFLSGGLNRINSSWLDSGTDLGMVSYNWGGTRTSFNVGNYYDAGVAPEVVNMWSHYYTGIRNVNKFLENVDNVPLNADETTESRMHLANRMKAEARFLRAYFYWEMALRYGDVPLITESLDPDDPELNNYTRTPFATVVDFILTEMEEAYNYLYDDVVAGANDEAGRITKGICIAMRARILLYLASPQHNPSGDIEKWQKALSMTKWFMTQWGHEADVPLYYLNTIDQEDKGQAYLNAITLRRVGGNPEVIFWRNSGQGNWWSVESPVGYGGLGGLCPSQNLVDMYDMESGYSPFTSYDETGAPVYSDPAFGVPAGINSRSEYTENRPYSSRDPRFYRTVLFNGAIWWDLPIQTYIGGKDKPVGNLDATPTGYYNRKYHDNSGPHYLNGGTMYRNWIIMRYAEILLNYAEIVNEIDGATDEVFSTLDMLRSRVGILLPLKTSHPHLIGDQAQMRNFIRKERAVELCFEEHRWWDVRRWKIADKALGRPLYGMRLTLNDDNSITYYRIKVQDRPFEEKMYLYPIPEQEIWKTGITNNPGW